jgi:hypothetical protein
MHAPGMVRFTITVAACIAITGIVPGSPAQAQPVLPSSPAATCSPGVPLRGDYNGDGTADPAVQAWQVTPETASFQIRLNAAGGAWLDGANTLRPADLNGDTCSDAVLTYSKPTPVVKLFLGSTDGLQDSGTTIVPPQVSSDAYSRFNAISLKHDGLVQIVVVGQARGHGFIDVYTLNKAGVPGSAQIIEGAPLKHVWSGSTSTMFGTQLAGSGRTVVIGSPDERGARHTYQGAVYLLRSSPKKPAKLVLQARITQSSKGIFGSPGQGHQLGSAVAYREGTVAIGMMGQSAGRGKGGVVQLLSWPDPSTHSYRAGRVFRREGAANTDSLRWRFGDQVTLARGLTAKGSMDLVITSHDGSQGASVVIANTRSAKRVVLNSATSYLPQRSWYQFGYTVTGVIRSSSTKDRLLIRISNEGEQVCGPNATYVTLASPGVISARTSWTELPAPDCSSGYAAWGRSFQ